jgi:hypothetical protein
MIMGLIQRLWITLGARLKRKPLSGGPRSVILPSLAGRRSRLAIGCKRAHNR